MATEEQTTNSSETGLYGAPGINRFGQKLTISARVVSKLSFLLAKYGSPTGNITFTIRKVSDDNIVASKSMDISTLSGYPSYTWTELTFDTPVFVNEEVRISAEYTGGDVLNSGIIRYQNTDVKASEFYSQYVYSWDDSFTTRDCAYIYTYEAGAAPTVITQVVTGITSTTATGNGNITDLGDAAVTAHGVCRNTTGTPTTADSPTDEGAASETGAFTSAMTGLTKATIYYVRAYATNSAGTGYGLDVAFKTAGSASGEASGVIAIVETRLHYVDAYGDERWIEGTKA